MRTIREAADTCRAGQTSTAALALQEGSDATAVAGDIESNIPVTSDFTIVRTGTGYNDWFSATAAAQDGDTILVKPQTYAFNVQGFTGITKALTVRSAVAGQRYVLAISRDPNSGAIGAGFAIDCLTRFQRTGSSARFAVTIEDAEIYADGLTYVTGKCAIDVGIASGSCPLDLTIRRCYVHDYDQALEASNEYNPADRTSTITIEDSIFHRCGCLASGDNNHTIYVGYCGSLSLKGCIVSNKRVMPGDDETRYPGGWADPTYDSGGSIQGPNYWPVGFLIKCRAKSLTIDGCRVTAQDSANSNCVEMGDGGDTLIRGTIFEQGLLADGNACISYGRFYHDYNRDAVYGEITSMDGRTNRLRMYQNTIVNSDPNSGQQFVEVSYHTTQAYWTAIGRAVAPPPLTIDIQNNLWVDNASHDAFIPETGYSPAPSGTGVPSAWGIACPGATNNAVKHVVDMVDETNRYVGWALATPVNGSVNRAPFAIADVPIADYASRNPTTTPRSDTLYGASLPQTTAPAWFTSALIGGWTSLTNFPPIGSQMAVVAADRANPDDVGGSWKGIYPTYGDSAGYVTSNASFPAAGYPTIAGVPACPGSTDYRGDQGCSGVISGVTLKRRGVTYEGSFVIWPAGGGHGEGIQNQILGYHLETGNFLDLTQLSIPPMGIADANTNLAFSAWHGGPKGATQVGPGADGRPLSTHQYNSIVYDRNRNRVLWVDGPAQVVGPGINVVYCVQLDGDSWDGSNDAVMFPARFKDYLSTADGAFPNGRNSVNAVDCVADEIWNSFPNSGFANDVFVVRASLAPGSKWEWVQVTPQPSTQTAQIAGAAVVGWCLENEPWLVWFNEVRPYQGPTILNRRYANQLGRRRFWNVTLSPKDGNPLNAIPTAPTDPNFGSNVDGGIASTVVFDPVDRLFYAIVFGLDSTALMDVYRITPPPFDPSGADGIGSTFVGGIGGTETVIPWTSEKLPLAAGSVKEWPTRGNTTPGTLYYPSHKTASFVHTDTMKGIFFMHDPGRNPIFWRAP